jgi:hypothetical protein
MNLNGSGSFPGRYYARFVPGAERKPGDEIIYEIINNFLIATIVGGFGQANIHESLLWIGLLIFL